MRDERGRIDLQTPSLKPRRIVVIAAPGASLLDIVAVVEVFSSASDLFVAEHPGSPRPYSVEIGSTNCEQQLPTQSGLSVTGTICYTVLRGSVDTLLIAGGSGHRFRAALSDPMFIRWLRNAARWVRRVGSLSTGAFFLAEAGLLDGKRATTHWDSCKDLARNYPSVAVDPDPIFVVDSGVYTSAGAAAGLDLALALVEEDHGARLAHGVARKLVLYMRRPGGQKQLSVVLTSQTADPRSIRELEVWIAEHVTSDLSVRALASRAAMSPRNFARVFERETGFTPADYVSRIRIEIASRRLEESDDSIDQIAAQCGFGSAASMRRTFRRIATVAPTTFRRTRRQSGDERLLGPRLTNSSLPPDKRGRDKAPPGIAGRSVMALSGTF
jgi:transcriptional regulator GlxA family with amidase domain